MKRSNISLAIAFVALGSNALGDRRSGHQFRGADETPRGTPAQWMRHLGHAIVSFDVMPAGFFRDAKAHYGDILYWSRFPTWEEPVDHARHLYPICHFLHQHQGWAGRGRRASGGRAALFGTAC